MSDEIPDRIGSYSVRGELGRGSFARAYRVSADHGGSYALKVNLVDDASHRERLENEASVLRRLSHPGIPKFIEAGGDSKPFVVMGLAPGETVEASIERKQSIGAVHGHVETLQVLRGLLGILEYLHGEGVVHRDIKAANVLVTQSASNVSLIDFGFAKGDGVTAIRVADSFFRAGAVRYSPPRKIENPGTAQSSHDVFASGVLAYRMLTGEYPWTVAQFEDLGAYHAMLESQSPEPVDVKNTLVPREVSELVMSLLNVDDLHRPSATEALSTTEALLENSSGGAMRRRPGRPTYPHVSRDPLYGDVRLTEFEWEVLHTPEVQRLRFIKQLGLTNYIFSGAEHSRLSHSIGSLYRVEQILGTIEDIEGVSVDLETRLVARLFALVHDVPQVAFGHTVEDELGLFRQHDSNIPRLRRLILDSTSKLNQKLKENEFGRAVVEHFDPEATVHRRTEVPELVAGSTGADVLDYIDRDAYYCGLDHRVDSAIFRQFRWHRDAASDDRRLISLLYGSEGLRLDRSYAVESLLRERFAMFLKVYTNKTKTAASALLGKAMDAMLDPGASGRPALLESEYEWMADAEVLGSLESSRRSLPSELGRELRLGRLPRGVFRAQLLSESNRNRDAHDSRFQQLREDGYLNSSGRMEIEADLAKRAGLDPSQVIVYCPTRAPGYQRVRHTVAESGGVPHALDSEAAEFRDVESKHLALWELWVFTRAENRDRDGELAVAIEDRIGLHNLIAQDRRATSRLFS